MATLIDEVVRLVREGWRPYQGTVDAAVYEQRRCPRTPLSVQGKGKSKNGPYWFNRGDVFLCIGCGRRCSLNRPDGFEAPLPIKYPTLCKEMPYTLSPREMVAKLPLLTIRQAAYCLNVSERYARDLVDMGRLRRLQGEPVRVSAEDVQREMENWQD